MKDKLGIILGVIAVIGVTYLLFTQNNKKEVIAYVETIKIVDGFEGTKIARKDYEEKSKVWQANTDTLLVQWENELKNYEKERGGMTDKEIELKEELLRNKQQQLGQYQDAMKRKAAEEDQNMTLTIMNDIDDYLKEYGKRKGYTYILGTSNGNIVYAEDALNITQEVLTGLNSEYNNK